jgi:hypothetical protein
METLKKSSNNNEYINQYQKTKYANNEEYRQNILEMNRKNYYEKYKDNQIFKEKIKANNKKSYEKIKQMKETLLLLENSSNLQIFV